MKQKNTKATIIPTRLYFELYLNKFFKNAKHIFLPTFLAWTIISASIFLLLNIFLSQQISALFLGVTSYNKNSVVNYLRNIRYLPIFKTELENNTNIYGNGLKNEVFSVEISQNQLIQNYEQLLEKNPDSRDLLYGLSLLYSQSNNSKKADEYLLKAKTIDPNIK